MYRANFLLKICDTPKLSMNKCKTSLSFVQFLYEVEIFSGTVVSISIFVLRALMQGGS